MKKILKGELINSMKDSAI